MEVGEQGGCAGTLGKPGFDDETAEENSHFLEAFLGVLQDNIISNREYCKEEATGDGLGSTDC